MRSKFRDWLLKSLYFIAFLLLLRLFTDSLSRGPRDQSRSYRVAIAKVIAKIQRDTSILEDERRKNESQAKKTDNVPVGPAEASAQVELLLAQVKLREQQRKLQMLKVQEAVQAEKEKMKAIAEKQLALEMKQKQKLKEEKKAEEMNKKMAEKEQAEKLKLSQTTKKVEKPSAAAPTTILQKAVSKRL